MSSNVRIPTEMGLIFNILQSRKFILSCGAHWFSDSCFFFSEGDGLRKRCSCCPRSTSQTKQKIRCVSVPHAEMENLTLCRSLAAAFFLLFFLKMKKVKRQAQEVSVCSGLQRLFLPSLLN